MAVHTISGFRILSPDFSFSKKYWSLLSTYVITNYGKDEINESQLVQTILKECFQILCKKFEELILKQNKASFLLTVHNYHENSVEIYRRQLGGEIFDLESSQFATTRRILKIILEQGCKIDLVGAPNFAHEISENQTKYDKIIEELLYIGYWSIVIADYIATSQLFTNSVGIQNKDGSLVILINSPYNHFIDSFLKDIPNHDGDVVLQDTISDFKHLLELELGLNYDNLTAIISRDFNAPENRYAIIKYEELINKLVSDYTYNNQYVVDFYDGLTVSTDNVLLIEDCILRNQDERRITYRPIIKLTIDKEKYWIIGSGKWSESLATLTTNALPFGRCPKEWLKNSAIEKFINKVSNYHDRILEDPIESILQKHSYKYDRNLKALCNSKSEHIRIDQEGVGEIDFIFIDEIHSVIYVVECKHNRSRFDMFNWRRDYGNFKKIYEQQLERKVNWCRMNTGIINYHFSKKYNDFELDLKNFHIRGVFVINAPTIYMLNGKFRAFTIKNFRDLINGNYVDKKFLYKQEDGNEVQIGHPYFDNTKRYFHLKNIASKISELSLKDSSELAELFQKNAGIK